MKREYKTVYKYPVFTRMLADIFFWYHGYLF